MNPRTKATIQMLVCASLWSIAGIFIKIIPWNPFVIAGWRSLISAATVLVYLRANRVSFRFNRHSVINGVMMSATFLCFVAANKLTTAANAIVLQFTAPVFILIFSAVLLHQKFKKGDVLVVVCTMAGISLFFFDQLEGGYLLGNCVAILAGAFMASMFLAVSHADEESRMGGMILGHLFTAAAGLPFMLFTENPVTPAAVASILDVYKRQEVARFLQKKEKFIKQLRPHGKLHHLRSQSFTLPGLLDDLRLAHALGIVAFLHHDTG